MNFLLKKRIMKINLGSGKRFLKGYIHIDCQKYEHIQYISQIDDLSFLESESVDEIYSSHAFEYFDDVQAPIVLSEWRRVLKKEGKLRISVPNFDALLKVYKITNDLGRITGPLYGRWQNSSNVIYHRTCYNFNKLSKLLKESKFHSVETWDPFDFFNSIDPNYDDYSKAVYPHMDFKNGFQISLNIVAKKVS